MAEFMNIAGFPAEIIKEFGEREWVVSYARGGVGKLVHTIKVANRPSLPEKIYDFTLDQVSLIVVSFVLWLLSPVTLSSCRKHSK